MKILLHVGLHRAGSTSFQAWLEANRRHLADRRQFLFSDLSSGKQGSLFGALVGKTLETAGAEAVAALALTELERLGQHFDGGIISDENLLGPMPGAKVPAFSALERLSRVIEIVAQQHEVLPIVILREPMAWLVSLYRVAQYRSETMGFAGFANSILPEGTGLMAMLESLARAAGRPPLASSLEAIAADGGHRFLARVAEELGCGSHLQGPLRKVNLTPTPLMASLRQEAARQGYFVLVEGARPLQRLIAELWHDKESRTSQRLLNAAGMIRTRIVRLQPGLSHQLRMQRAARRLHTLEDQDKFIPLSRARKMLNAAFAAAEAPLATAAEIEPLALRLGRDWASIDAYLNPPEDTP